MVYNCSCLATDLGKIFDAYWFLGDSQSVPSPWPASFSTLYNKDTPLQLPLNGTPSHVYLSVRHCAAMQRRDHTVVSLKLSQSSSFLLRLCVRVRLLRCAQLAGLQTYSPSSASWRTPTASSTSLS